MVQQSIVQLFDQGAKVVINYPIRDEPGATLEGLGLSLNHLAIRAVLLEWRSQSHR